MSSLAHHRQLSLTIVCCHSIFHGTDPFDEDGWALAPFQRATTTKPSEHVTFLEHIRTGLRNLMKSQNDADEQVGRYLVFSGGPTNASYPGLTEAQGYFHAAHYLVQNEIEFSSIAKLMDERCNHVLLEQHATDSFQNILFGIMRCYEALNKYPDRVTVVTHAFKTERFEIHRQAIKWKREWVIMGIDPPFDEAEREMVTRFERQNALNPFKNDLYGVRSPLKDKRMTRGWNDETFEVIKKTQPTSVQRLVLWNGGDSGDVVFDETLDWE